METCEVDNIRIKQNIDDCTIPDQWVPYFESAESHADVQWNNFLWPILKDCDLSTTLELAPGAGRIATRTLPLTNRMFLVDVNQYALELCLKRFADSPHREKLLFCLNNGKQLQAIPDDILTTIYCWDSAVHFDRLIIKSYLQEFKRTLRTGGKVLIHHSNLGISFCSEDFKENPHWRSNMSAKLMVEYCNQLGLNIESQKILDWGEPNLDCISVLSRTT